MNNNFSPADEHNLARGHHTNHFGPDTYPPEHEGEKSDSVLSAQVSSTQSPDRAQTAQVQAKRTHAKRTEAEQINDKAADPQDLTQSPARLNDQGKHKPAPTESHHLAPPRNYQQQLAAHPQRPAQSQKSLNSPSENQKSPGKIAARRRKTIGVYLGLAFAALLAVAPLLFMIVSSFKASDQQILSDLRSVRAFLPIGDLTLDNYFGAWERVPVGRFILNSVVITFGIVLLGLIVNSMIGFAIARMRFRGAGFVLSIVLATLMVPFETIAVPLVYWVSKLPVLTWVQDGFLLKQGMLNTYQVQILPFAANALAIFLFVQHFKTIPKEFDEAARVDGASWWTIYRRIIVPMSGPTFATVAIITMLPAWNSYLWPLMVIQKTNLRPASVGMQYFFQLNPDWGQIMAYATIITVPVLIVFVIFQRSFVASLASSGVKG